MSYIHALQQITYCTENDSGLNTKPPVLAKKKQNRLTICKSSTYAWALSSSVNNFLCNMNCPTTTFTISDSVSLKCNKGETKQRSCTA